VEEGEAVEGVAGAGAGLGEEGEGGLLYFGLVLLLGLFLEEVDQLGVLVDHFLFFAALGAAI
jgi:hypothetical protein